MRINFSTKIGKIFYHPLLLIFSLALIMEGSNTMVELSKEKKVPRCKWTEKAVESLLLFLKEYKGTLKELVKKRGGNDGNIKSNLWDYISIMVSDDENQYLPKQCEVKWKNIKRYYKVKLLSLIKKIYQMLFIV